MHLEKAFIVHFTPEVKQSPFRSGQSAERYNAKKWFVFLWLDRPDESINKYWTNHIVNLISRDYGQTQSVRLSLYAQMYE